LSNKIALRRDLFSKDPISRAGFKTAEYGPENGIEVQLVASDV
jgi:hypothetical protein